MSKTGREDQTASSLLTASNEGSLLISLLKQSELSLSPSRRVIFVTFPSPALSESINILPVAYNWRRSM